MGDSSYTKSADVEIESNVSDSGFETTDSKARLVYRDFIQTRKIVGFLSALVSIFASTLVSLLTSQFNDVFGIDNSHFIVMGMFVMACVASFVASIVLSIILLRKRKMLDEDAFINKLHQTGNTKK